MEKIKVLVFPKDKNPYQELLYESALLNNVQISYLISPFKSHVIWLLFLIPQIILYRIKGYTLFHIHWLYIFQLNNSSVVFKNFIIRFLFFIYFVIFIFLVKIIGFNIIWTVHNIIPHRRLFMNDLLASKILSNLSSIKIVHTKSTLNQMEKMGFNVRNIFIIPHGNFINYYKYSLNSNITRKNLNISNHEFVFLFFGKLEEYKGILDLLKEFTRLSHEWKNIKLLVVGQCTDTKILHSISIYRKKLGENKLITKLGYIQDYQVANYFRIADIAVFPFKKITTSGSVLLSLSLGKSVIVPKIGNLTELPNNVGFFYKNEEVNSLYFAMQRSLVQRLSIKTKNQAALKYASEISWSKISSKTFDLYKFCN